MGFVSLEPRFLIYSNETEKKLLSKQSYRNLYTPSYILLTPERIKTHKHYILVVSSQYTVDVGQTKI